jgi:hypothetical protein
MNKQFSSILATSFVASLIVKAKPGNTVIAYPEAIPPRNEIHTVPAERRRVDSAMLSRLVIHAAKHVEAVLDGSVLEFGEE